MALNTLGIIKNGTKIKIPAVFVPEQQESVSVTADGVKSYATLLADLYALIDSAKVSYTSKLVHEDSSGWLVFSVDTISSSRIFMNFVNSYDSSFFRMFSLEIRSANAHFRTIEMRSSGNTLSTLDSSVPASGTKLVFYY